MLNDDHRMIAGSPSPSVIWLRNGAVIDSDYTRWQKSSSSSIIIFIITIDIIIMTFLFSESTASSWHTLPRTENNTVDNLLTVAHLTRFDLLSQFVCISAFLHFYISIFLYFYLGLICTLSSRAWSRTTTSVRPWDTPSILTWTVSLINEEDYVDCICFGDDDHHYPAVCHCALKNF